jgi:hypothetical protein
MRSRTIISKVRGVKLKKQLQKIIILQELDVTTTARQTVQLTTVLRIEQNLNSLQATYALPDIRAQLRNLLLAEVAL